MESRLMPLRGKRGTIWLTIVAVFLTAAAVFFLMTNDINQVLRGVGQPAPEDLVEEETGAIRPSPLNRP